MVYSSVPSSLILSSLLGMVMLCATDFFPLWKKVSGVQILLAIRLFRGKIFIGPWNFNLSSFQLCRKKTSMVYSWEKMRYVCELISLYYYFSYDLGSPCIKTRLIPTPKMLNCALMGSSSQLTSPASSVGLSLFPNSGSPWRWGPHSPCSFTAYSVAVFLSWLWGQHDPLNLQYCVVKRHHTQARI